MVTVAYRAEKGLFFFWPILLQIKKKIILLIILIFWKKDKYDVTVIDCKLS